MLLLIPTYLRKVILHPSSYLEQATGSHSRFIFPSYFVFSLSTADATFDISPAYEAFLPIPILSSGSKLPSLFAWITIVFYLLPSPEFFLLFLPIHSLIF